MPDTREIALTAVKDSLLKKRFLSFPPETPAAEMAFLNNLCLTAFRCMSGMEDILQQFIKKPLPSKALDAKLAIILALTELLYMDTPDYAVLNSCVNIIKRRTNRFLAGMANAVLRKICNQKNDLGQFSGRFFPDSFKNILLPDYSPEIIAKIEQASVREPPLTISVKKDAPAWADKLKGKFIAANSICIKNPGKITELPGYADGSWWVQDFAASLAVSILPALSGAKVLDLCAAPGGKTAQLLSLGARVVSLDISNKRLQTLRTNIARLHLPQPEIIAADALEYLKEAPAEQFDAVILDAPCSATGIFRRHPELVHFKTSEDVARQTGLQKKLLNEVPRILKKGGTLVYSVCSIAKSEGEKQILDFLKSHPGFRIIPISSNDICGSSKTVFRELTDSNGFIRTLPFMLKEYGGLDSFFIAKLQKEKE